MILPHNHTHNSPVHVEKLSVYTRSSISIPTVRANTVSRIKSATDKQPLHNPNSKTRTDENTTPELLMFLKMVGPSGSPSNGFETCTCCGLLAVDGLHMFTPP